MMDQEQSSGVASPQLDIQQICASPCTRAVMYLVAQRFLKSMSDAMQHESTIGETLMKPESRLSLPTMEGKVS